jgi:NADH dehydrogenase
MILVCGATGALGGTVARNILERGEKVRVLVREASAYEALAELGADLAFGDLKDPTSLREATQVDVVVTTATAIARGGADTIAAVDSAGSANLIEASRTAGVRQFVYTSVLAAKPGFVTPIDPMGAERSDPHSELRSARAATEDLLAASGLQYTVVAPHAFMELWLGGFVGNPFAAGEPVTLVAPATARHGFVSRRDVAAFIVAAVGNSAAYGRRIPVCGPEHLSWHDVIHVFERVLDRRTDLRLIEPGSPIPGLPEYAAPLLAGPERVETTSIDMSPLANEFGVRQTSVEDFVRAAYANA